METTNTKTPTDEELKGFIKKLFNRTDWTFKDWSKKDPKGLLFMQNNAHTEFEKLYNKEYVKNEDLENRNKWTYKDWEANDTKGLIKMFTSEPTKYNKLLNNYIKKQP